MFITYDDRFNANEWFVFGALFIGLFLLWKIREDFSTKELLAYFLFSLTIGMTLDHILSIEPFELYDVNDSSAYEVMDFITYVIYGPYGCIFVYIYNRFGVKEKLAPVYVLIWSMLSVLVEVLAGACGVFHYRNGYNLYYSFPTYLLTFSILVYLHRLIKRTGVRTENDNKKDC